MVKLFLTLFLVYIGVICNLTFFNLMRDFLVLVPISSNYFPQISTSIFFFFGRYFRDEREFSDAWVKLPSPRIGFKKVCLTYLMYL